MGDGQRQGAYVPAGRMGNSPIQSRVDTTDTSLSLAPAGSPSAPYPSQAFVSPPHQGTDTPQAFAPSTMQPLVVTMAPDSAETSLAMGSMAAALPQYRMPPQSYGMPQQTIQRYPQGGMMSQPQQQILQFAGQTGLNSSPQNASFASQYITSYPPGHQGGMAPQSYLMQQSGHQQRGGIPSPSQQQFPGNPYFSGPQSPSQPFMYYPPAYAQMSPSQQNFQGSHRPHDGGMNAMGGGYHQGIGHGVPGGQGFNIGLPLPRAGGPAASRPNNATSPISIPSAPRGPPRKPKQSGHALWVGNLPPGALVNDLKDHFSRDATKDIESVFLISKSNCAFVNYRTEAACTAAMTRFHDSRFQGVRLVCRLRRTPATPASGVPTGPAALAPTSPQQQTATDAITQNRESSSKAEESYRQDGGVKVNDKYFVVKSLTVEDLELSARNGIWATQAHNEAALNRAYESVDNVFLVFSANKSGEYFGYARMASPINDEAAADLKWTPRAEAVVDDPELPRSIPTLATETAPKGRIIDDSARGTIFWEADPIEHSPCLSGETLSEPLIPAMGELDGEKSGASDSDDPTAAGPQTFGKPFKIEWVSTVRLPFYRTRGLRNPWNANREVKIARDGTELETSVGRRLVQMFHRTGPTPNIQQQPLSLGMQSPMGYPGMPGTSPPNMFGL